MYMCTATHEFQISLSSSLWTPAFELRAILNQVYQMTLNGFEHQKIKGPSIILGFLEIRTDF